MLYIGNAFALSMIDRASRPEIVPVDDPAEFTTRAIMRAVEGRLPADFAAQSGDPLAARLSFAHGRALGAAAAEAAGVVLDQDGTPWYTSCVGHEDTANLMAAVLNRTVPCNRTSIKLVRGDQLLVAQYIGPRLPEGTRELPAGSRFEWWAVNV